MSERGRVGEGEVEQASVLSAALAHKWLVILVTLGAALAALIYSISRPPRYEAVTTVVLDVQDPAAVVGLTSARDENRLVRNQLQVFRSASVALQATTLVNEEGFEVSIGEVIDNSEFSSLPETDVITITFAHEDQATAEAVVNSLVEAYRQVRLDQRQAESQAGLEQLESAELVLLDQLTSLEGQISELRLPRAITPQIAALLDQISIVSRDVTAASGDQRTALLDNLNGLTNQLEALQFALQVEGEDPAIASLLRQQQNLVVQLAELAGRKTEVRIGAEALESGISFVATPSSTDPGSTVGLLFTVLAGAALGLLVGVGIAFNLSQNNRQFTHRLAPQRLLGIPFLADVPAFSTESELPVRDAPRSPEAEAFRFVAANLDFIAKRHDVRSVLVVSGAVGDGKSTVAANVALASARSGRRVLVIDADFGNQALSQMLLGRVPSGPGLTELLSGRAQLSEVLSRLKVTDRASIDLLSRGQESTVATEVFNDKGMDRLLSTVTEPYDLVLIDGPPMMQVAYASILALLADSILTVIPAYSDVEAALELDGRLRFMEIPILGYVYNKAPLRREMAEPGGSMKDILGDLGMVEAVPERSRR